MYITRSPLIFIVIILITVASACKKTETNSETQVIPEECDPVTFTSTPSLDTYIVILKNNNASARMATPDQVRLQSTVLLQKHNIQVSQLRSVVNSIDGGFIASLSGTQARELKTDEAVQIMEKDRVLALTVGCFTIVRPSSVQWGVRRVGAADGTGKRVWIIDTGVETGNADLNVDTTLSKSFVDDEPSVEDGNGHGTHVAGIIGALNNKIGVLGVASGVSIIALKALNKEGKGNTSLLIKALNYVGQNARAGEVVNMSLGADTISEALDNAVLTLAKRGILFAIAAGNDTVQANLSSPGRVNHPNIYTVSAIDSLGVFARFSDFGNDVVDMAAPGVDITSTFTNGRYAILSGTSMAAPHVAGILVIEGNKIKTKGTATHDPDGVPDGIASY